MILHAVCVLLALTGSVFFLAGTVGLLRFPDTLSRLHALTKADNLGLGLIMLALALHGGSLSVAVKLFAIWLLAMLAGTTNCYLMGRHTTDNEALQQEMRHDKS
jgi:multicomponent Na+:H+ antiporter subunit G